MSDIPEDPAESLQVDIAVVFPAARDLQDRLNLQSGTRAALPSVSHAGGREVLALVDSLVSDLRTSMAAQGEALANAIRLIGVETVIADQGWEFGGGPGGTNPNQSWYGM